MIRNEEEQYNYDKEWEISRKTFLRSVLLGSIALSLPLVSCEERGDDKVYSDIEPLTQRQFKTLRAVQSALLPSSENKPGAIEVNADRYFLWIINDPRMNPRENDFLVKKLSAIEDIIVTKTNYHSDELTIDEMTDVLEDITKEGWEKRWTSRMLTIIFEALLLDPIYGINTDESGWKWLDFKPGSPRVIEKYKYPEILEIVKK